MTVESKDWISGQEGEQQNRIKIRDMVRHINPLSRKVFKIKLDDAASFEDIKENAQTKPDKVSQNSSTPKLKPKEFKQKINLL